MEKNIDSCKSNVVQRLIENGFIESEKDLSADDIKKLQEVIMHSDCYSGSQKEDNVSK